MHTRLPATDENPGLSADSSYHILATQILCGLDCALTFHVKSKQRSSWHPVWFFPSEYQGRPPPPFHAPGVGQLPSDQHQAGHHQDHHIRSQWKTVSERWKQTNSIIAQVGSKPISPQLLCVVCRVLFISVVFFCVSPIPFLPPTVTNGNCHYDFHIDIISDMHHLSSFMMSWVEGTSTSHGQIFSIMAADSQVLVCMLW